MTKLVFLDHKEMAIEGDRYELDIYAFGDYKVTDMTVRCTDGFTDRTINATPESACLPQVTCEDRGSGFTFRVTGTPLNAGPLDSFEFARYLRAQQKALELGEMLTKELLPGHSSQIKQGR